MALIVGAPVRRNTTFFRTPVRHARAHVCRRRLSSAHAVGWRLLVRIASALAGVLAMLTKKLRARSGQVLLAIAGVARRGRCSTWRRSQACFTVDHEHHPTPPTPHVVHVTEVLGGVETYLTLMLDHSHESVRYGFVLARESAFADTLRERGHEVLIVPMPRTRTLWREVRAVRRLRRALQTMAPDVVHLHSTQAGLLGRLAWARRGHFVVHTPHAYYYLGKTGAARFFFLAVEVALARILPTRVLTTSPSETVRAVRDVRVPGRRVVTCTNAVKIPPMTRPRELTGAPARVGLVGRVSPQKNLPMYLRTVSRLLDDPRIEADYHFVGLGHYDDDVTDLHAMMQDADVPEEGLELHSWMPRQDLLTWLRSCDVLVLTSAYESFGYALAEATALGIPVVGTNIDGIRDVVLNGVNGFVVPRDDDAAMAESVVEILSRPEEYREMSRLGHAIAARRTNIATFTGQIEHFYLNGELPTAGTSRRASGAAPAALFGPRTREDSRHEVAS